MSNIVYTHNCIMIIILLLYAFENVFKSTSNCRAFVIVEKCILYKLSFLYPFELRLGRNKVAF